MRVRFITPSLSRRAGGIFEIERRLALEMASGGFMSLEVLGAWDEDLEQDHPGWAPLEPRAFQAIGSSGLCRCSPLGRAVMAADLEIVHLHALWMHSSVLCRHWARRTGRPTSVTINGMLGP